MGRNIFIKKREALEMSNMSRVSPTIFQRFAARGVENEKGVKAIMSTTEFRKNVIKEKKWTT